MQSPALSISGANALDELIAVQLGHRVSVDLDFFTTEEFDNGLLNDNLSKIESYTLDRLAENTLLGIIFETKISFFTYHYPLIDKTVNFGGITLAGLKDIAAMKIDAIGRRGTRRDFIDLYLLCKEFSLEKCLDFYIAKYPNRKENIFHIIKSLSYFEDADKSGQPEMLVLISRDEVMKYFTEETKKIADKFLQ